MEIKQMIVPKGSKNRPAYPMTPKYITIHDTGNIMNGAGARNHALYIARGVNNVGWHFTVDDKEIYHHIPTNENAWHAEDGRNGTGNRSSIGIEICMHPECDRVKAEANAAWLCNYLMDNVPSLLEFPNCIKQHWNWSKKNCPQIIRARPNGWNIFLKQIEGGINKMAEKWEIDLGIEAIKGLAKRGFINNSELWIARLKEGEPLPDWVIWHMFNKLK